MHHTTVGLTSSKAFPRPSTPRCDLHPHQDRRLAAGRGPPLSPSEQPRARSPLGLVFYVLCLRIARAPSRTVNIRDIPELLSPGAARHAAAGATEHRLLLLSPPPLTVRSPPPLFAEKPSTPLCQLVGDPIPRGEIR
jgi:hypothetical protein